jgi:hypothetical protein
MAFGNVKIVSTRNGVTPIVGWRQDLAIGDVVSLALSSDIGVSSYRWELVGRPEGSSAGGPGPEPCLLGTGATCSFTVDNDSGMIRDGTYVIHCTLNGGTPTDTIIRVGLARLAPGLSYNGLPLRRLGYFERDEDTHEPLVAGESTKMLDRWLGLIGGGGTPDAHDVKADTSDSAPAFLDTKLKAGANVSLEVVVDGGVRKVQITSTGGGISFWDAPTTPIGSSNPGVSPLVSHGDHSHAGQDPAEVRSKLYPAKIDDPNNRGDLLCCFLGPHDRETNTPMLAEFAEIAHGVRQNTVTGLLPASWFDGVDPTPPTDGSPSSIVGQTVLVYYQGDSSEHGDEEPLQGPWVIDDVGAQWLHVDPDPPGVLRLVSTYARMHRAPDYSYSSQFVQNMTFQVRTGNIYGTGFLRLNNPSLNLGVDAQSWTFTAGPTYPWATTYACLTGPQLTSQKASSETAENIVTTASYDGRYVEVEFPPDSFLSLAGTPGVDMAAGLYKFAAEAVRISGSPSPGSLTNLRARLIDVDTGSMEILVADSVPITSTVDIATAFSTTLATTYALAPTKRLRLAYYIRTNSTNPITMHLRYTSASRGTWIQVPFSMPGAGTSTGRHNDLSGRDGKDGICHPTSASAPSVSTDSGGGWLWLGDGSNDGNADCVEFTITDGHFYGINKTWSDGTAIPNFKEVCVHLVNASSGSPIVVHNAATPPDGTAFLPLVLPWNSGDDQDLEFARPTDLWFRLDLSANVWRLKCFTSY